VSTVKNQNNDRRLAYQNQKTIYRKTIEIAQDFEIAAASETHHEGSTD